MIWVMIMFAITQGLRVDEVITLTYEQFLQQYFDVDESSHVDSLVFTVNGKRDENDVILYVGTITGALSSPQYD